MPSSLDSPPVATPRAGAPDAPWRHRLASGLAGATVLAQITYPLVPPGGRARLSVGVVVLASSAAVAHVRAELGAGPAVAYAGAVAGTSLLAEALGVATGAPFGDYAYSSALGPHVLGVPLVVPLAWTMMTWPSLVAARALLPGAQRRRRLGRAALGGATLAAWDLFLDPQLVAEDFWRWLDVVVEVPGSGGVPVSNTAGWLLVGTLVAGLADSLLPDGPERVGQPLALLTWAWAGSTLAHVAFFGRPLTALVGGTGLGAVVVPLLGRLAARRGRPGR